MLSQERIRDIFFHTPGIGVLTWRSASRGHRAGMVAGSLAPNGYVTIWADRGTHMAHRLIWTLVHGACPPSQIDHINGVRHDNRIENLRLATPSENGQNRRGAQVNSQSGILGVFWYARKRKWKSFIGVIGKPHHLGYFDSLLDAVAARLRAERAMFTHSPR